MIAELVKKYGVSPEDAESLNAAMRVVCTSCSRELGVANGGVGVTVVETAHTPRRPYLLWGADLLECPECGLQVVSRFAVRPFARDHSAQEQLTSIQAHGGEVFYCHEH